MIADQDLPSYPENTEVTLTAVPDHGWVFDGWFGDTAGTTNPLTLHITRHMHAGARFVPAAWAPGSVWMDPSHLTRAPFGFFTTRVYVDSSSDLVAAYGFTLTYDPSVIVVNVETGTRGVLAGADGFVTAVNADCPGTLVIAGFDVNGTGPGSGLRFLGISWRALATGTHPTSTSVSTP